MLCPIAIDDAWFRSSMSGQLRTQIRKYNVLDFSSWRDPDTFERQTGRLIEGLEKHYGH